MLQEKMQPLPMQDESEVGSLV